MNFSVEPNNLILAMSQKVQLTGFSSLPADSFAPGPSSGNLIQTTNRPIPFNSQPIQGFSGVQLTSDGNYWFLSDNGFGAKNNSADYLLRIYKVDPDFKTVEEGTGVAEPLDFIQLKDSNDLIAWEIVNEDSSDRLLTGADFDIESLVIAKDGTLWIGDEFGPYLLHFDANGVLLEAPIPTPNISPSGQPEFVYSPDNPEVLAGNVQANLGGSGGFEGMAYNLDRTKLYPLLEKRVSGDPDNALRIYEYDLTSSQWAEDLIGFYGLDVPNHAIGDFTPINEKEFLVIERDGGQGETAQFKKVFKIDISQVDENGYVQKEELVDLLNIADPNDLNGDGNTTFTFPFVTIEDVLILDEKTLLIANDNNYPFSVGRGPDIDNNEIIKIELSTPLNLDLRLPVSTATSLPNGVASGDVSQDSAVLWTRSTALGEVVFEYATDEEFSTILGSQSANVTDITQPVKVELDGLTAATEYFYRVTTVTGETLEGRFKTATEVGTQAGLNFGVTGDWRGELAPYPAISNVAPKALDFFVELGDTIYADYSSPEVPKPQAETLADFRAKHSEVYSQRYGVNSWADLRASTPILATIDDHEVTNDFVGSVPAFTDADNPGNDTGSSRFGNGNELINETELYQNGIQAFQEYNPIQDLFYGETGDEVTANKPKLYRYNTYGSDAVTIVLDNRSFRDAPLEPADTSNPSDIARFYSESLTQDRTMLGEVQLEDLKQDLLAAENAGITWKFVMVPEPMQNIGPVAAQDRFEGYGKERTEILQFINENDIDNVVFIAADVHVTLVNNLTYQTELGGDQIATSAFEITTGSVAFYPPTTSPFPTISFKDLVNQQALIPFGFDPLGLDENLPQAEGLIDATLLTGDYVVDGTFGWSEFNIDPETQQLTVTTYAIDAYDEVTLLSNPEEVLSRTPEILSQFVVNPQPLIEITPISTIQGSGLTTSLLGEEVIIEGIVVGDFQASNQLRGFYIQSPDDSTDNDPSTSEGIFIFDPSLTVNVEVGDFIQVSGTVNEFTSGGGSSLTQLNNITEIEILSSDNSLPTVTTVTVPVSDLVDWEAYEGMLVEVVDANGDLTVTDNFNLGRFGEVILSADGRVFQYTNFEQPDVEGNTAYQEEVLRRTFIVDDGSTLQNVYVEPIVRNGSTLESITGIADDRFSVEYRIQPTEDITYEDTNPRSATPDDVGGSLKVASFNVLNYFNGDGIGAGFPTSRGANSLAEFNRQRDKIISAILGIDADVVGLIEIENDGYGNNSAIQDLINGLNAEAGAGTYAFVNPGVSQLGTDEITVGFIYQTDTVTPVGNAAILDASVDPNFDTSIQRPALAQTFKELSTNGVFTPVVNHLKSKSQSGLTDTSNPNYDQGDGQGFWNATRTNAAEALTNWLGTDPTNSDDEDYLILGDLNSYAFEDPIQAIEEAGYTNLAKEYVGEDSYSFVFFGQAGTLDYALANESLSDQVSGATIWHINADEPPVLDYNLEFKSDAQLALFEPDAFRSSDHDAVVVGLDLAPKIPKTVLGTAGEDFFDTVSPDPQRYFIGDNQVLFTGSGDDTIDVTQAVGGNRIDAGSGDDLIFAGANNRIIGGSGDDQFFVGTGEGNNQITGNAGADQFWIVTDEELVITANQIFDFNPTQDKIVFANTSFDFNSLGTDWTIRQESRNTVIDVLGQDVAVLQGVQPTALDMTNVMFM